MVVIGQRGGSAVWIVVAIGLLTAVGAAVGGWYFRDQSARQELTAKQDELATLQRKLSAAQTTPSPQPSVPGSLEPSRSTKYSSANLGFSVEVPAAWAGQWRYQEQSNVGISVNSVTFFLINKETKYQDVVAIGKVPIAKYDDAKATSQAVANPDNLLTQAGGFAYVMTFPEASGAQYKNFTYEQATTAVRDSLKKTFKIL